MIHEVLGHAAGFAHPTLARFQRSLGRAAIHARGDLALLGELERVYWWTIEFGLIEEGDTVRAFGAGILSSIEELQGLEHFPRLRPLDWEQAAHTPYDPTRVQAQLFVAADWPSLLRDGEAWLAQRMR